MPRECFCGSGLEQYRLNDARGIIVSYACKDCEAEVRACYRPEIFTDPNYWTDEPIDTDPPGSPKHSRYADHPMWDDW